MKWGFITFFVFLSVIAIAHAVTVFDISETDLLSIAPEVEDPDGDTIFVNYTEPFDQDGEWQTDYGDAGEYVATILVSDGTNQVSEQVVVLVSRTEAEPVITESTPRSKNPSVAEGQPLRFEVIANDPNDDVLSYQWRIDGRRAAQNQSFTYVPSFASQGLVEIAVEVADQVFEIEEEWDVLVEDVDLNSILDGVSDITIRETETAQLNLTGFSQHPVEIAIGDPLGVENRWETTYDDAGTYSVDLVISGADYRASKRVTIVVVNVDRSPFFTSENRFTTREGMELRIPLAAEDEDGDDIEYEVENLPAGAAVDGDEIVFTPDFDFVQKQTAFEYGLDNLKILSRTHDITVTAVSNDLNVTRSITVRVYDANQPFSLRLPEVILVEEGEQVVIVPDISDPDNDEVTVTYEGFMSTNTRSTGFEDAGSYVVKVTATDGTYRTVDFVTIQIDDVNRAPEFDRVSSKRVKEGQHLSFSIKAVDKDKDGIAYALVDGPAAAYVVGNEVGWAVPTTVAANQTVTTSITVSATDGTDTVEQTIDVLVDPVNQPPVVMQASKNIIVERGFPLTLVANAQDPENNELSYDWKFSAFDRVQDVSEVEKVYTSRGDKTVELTVSDGEFDVVRTWNIKVI